MADTIQIVRWALGQTCPLRQGDAATDCCKALGGVGRAATYGRYLGRSTEDGFGIFGDVCVMGKSSGFGMSPLLGRHGVAYPSNGFLISDTFAAVKGPDALVAMCAACPANTSWRRPAGCAGTLYKPPGGDETQAQLDGIIARVRLADEVRDAFPRTMPTWYGLWANSPLSPRAVGLLGVIVTALHAEDERGTPEAGAHLSDFRAFVRATEHAERHGLPLHVSLAPPGHTDFGDYVVFAHCPFCKAGAEGLPRWRRRYPRTPHTCHACGTQYVPADTASCRRDRYDHFGLRRALGPERFAAFAHTYLVAMGIPEADAAEIVRDTEASEDKSRRTVAAHQAKDRREKEFLTTVLFAGLHPIYRPDEPPDDGVEDGGDEYEVYMPPMFGAAEFAELLKRCEEHGVDVTTLSHQSADEDDDAQDKVEMFRPDDVPARPSLLFARWQKQGYRGLFRATFRVPDALLAPPAAAQEPGSV